MTVGTEKESAFRITVNDKILVHLLEYVRYKERPEVPREVTQQGIAEVVGARRSHVSLALSTLRERSLVEENTVRVTDEVRRRKGYFLSSKGYDTAKRLVEKYQSRMIRVEEAGGVKEVKIADLPQFLGEKYYLVDVLCCVNREGTLDIAQLTGQKVEAPEEERPQPKVQLARAMAICPMCFSRVEFAYDTEGPLTVVCGSCGNSFRTSIGLPVFQQTQVQPMTTTTKKPKWSVGVATLAIGLVLSVFTSLLMLSMALYAACGLAISTLPLLYVATFSLGKKEDRAIVAFATGSLTAAPMFIPSDELRIFWVALQFSGTFVLIAALVNMYARSWQEKVAVGDLFALGAGAAPIWPPWGFPLGFAMLMAAGALLAAVLYSTKVKEQRDKDVLAVSGLLAAFGAVTYVHWLIVPSWDAQALGRIALVVATLYAFALFARPVAKKTRAAIVSALGVFLIALGTFLAVAPYLVGWPPDIAVYFTIFGGGALYIAMRIRRLENLWSQVCVGVGLFIVTLSVLIVASEWPSLSPLWLVSLATWMVVGLALCATWFAREVVERVASVRAGAIAAVGAAIVLAGAYMFVVGLGVEGAVEIAIGVPLVGFAFLKSGAPWVPRLAVSSLFVLAVGFTWLATVAGIS